MSNRRLLGNEWLKHEKSVLVEGVTDNYERPIWFKSEPLTRDFCQASNASEPSTIFHELIMLFSVSSNCSSAPTRTTRASQTVRLSSPHAASPDAAPQTCRRAVGRGSSSRSSRTRTRTRRSARRRGTRWRGRATRTRLRTRTRRCTTDSCSTAARSCSRTSRSATCSPFVRARASPAGRTTPTRQSSRRA
jgi:hypothetical protein